MFDQSAKHDLTGLSIETKMEKPKNGPLNGQTEREINGCAQ